MEETSHRPVSLRNFHPVNGAFDYALCNGLQNIMGIAPSSIGVATIQQLIGRSSIQTTALYCHVSDEQLKNAANAG